MNIFRGAFTALITPMNGDGTVDFEGFRKNVKHQLEQGIDGLVPLGTTAETPTLDERPGEEEDKIISIVMEEVRAFEKSTGKKIPVLKSTATCRPYSTTRAHGASSQTALPTDLPPSPAVQWQTTGKPCQ